MTASYPRLGSDAAAELLATFTGQLPESLRALARTESDQCTWYATAHQRVDQQVLIELQSRVREVASGCGYPEPARERAPTLTLFDRKVGPVLFKTMDIVPADAADEGVWSFLSLVLLPDVAFWRFPNLQSRDDYERILGRPRHVFRRLWWRAFALGAEDGDPSTELLEDEAVAIMERPTIGGDPRVARAIATEHLAQVQRYKELQKELPRTDLMREAMKRLRRLTTLITLGALSDSELAKLFSEVFTSAAEVLSR